MEPGFKITIEELSPEEQAQFDTRRERCQRNWAWLEANAKEVYGHRGKFICIAGQELFVADTVEEAVARARAAHPEDDGSFIRYIPREKVARIYANQRRVAAM